MSQAESNISLIKIPYYPQLIRGLSLIFKAVNLHLAYSDKNTISKLLGNTKDNVDYLKKGGIYKTNCCD